MVRYIFYSTVYGPYLRSPNGIREFGELSLGELISNVTRKSADYREMDENLLVEKSNLRLVSDELARKLVLDSGEFFSVRRRIWADTFILSAILAAAVLLTYVSISALLEGGPVRGFFAWTFAAILAVVLMGGGTIAMTRLLEAALGRPGITQDRSKLDARLVVLWSVLLVSIEVAIWSMLQDRAASLVLGSETRLVGTAYVLLGMVLPFLGGAMRWDMLRNIDVYKRTQAQRQVENRLAQIDSVLRQNAEFESNYYKAESIKAWRHLNAFKAFKNGVDQKQHGSQEDLTGHFADSYIAFQAEADRRYGADIRNTTVPSFRKLENGSPLLPAASAAHEVTEPIAAMLSNGDGHTAFQPAQS